GRGQFGIGDLEHGAGHPTVRPAVEKDVGVFSRRADRRFETGKLVALAFEKPAECRPLHVFLLERAVGEKQRHGVSLDQRPIFDRLPETTGGGTRPNGARSSGRSTIGSPADSRRIWSAHWNPRTHGGCTRTTPRPTSRR